MTAHPARISTIPWRDPEFRIQESYADHALKAFPNHRHAYTELVIIAEGRGLQRVNGFKHEIHAGDVFVIQGEQVHGFEVLDNVFLWNVAFESTPALPGYETLRTIPGFISLFTLEPTAAAHLHSATGLSFPAERSPGARR